MACVSYSKVVGLVGAVISVGDNAAGPADPEDPRPGAVDPSGTGIEVVAIGGDEVEEEEDGGASETSAPRVLTISLYFSFSRA